MRKRKSHKKGQRLARSLKKEGCRGGWKGRSQGKEAGASLRAGGSGDGTNLAEDDSTVAVGGSDGEGNCDLLSSRKDKGFGA